MLQLKVCVDPYLNESATGEQACQLSLSLCLLSLPSLTAHSKDLEQTIESTVTRVPWPGFR